MNEELGLKSCLQEVLSHLGSADEQADAVFREVSLKATDGQKGSGDDLRPPTVPTLADLVRDVLGVARSLSKKVGMVHAAVCDNAADPLGHLLDQKGVGRATSLATPARIR